MNATRLRLSAAAVAASALFSACAEQAVDSSTSQLEGQWVIESAKLAALQPGTETMITPPTMVYPDRVVHAAYFDQPGYASIAFSGDVSFDPSGRMLMTRNLFLDGRDLTETSDGDWYIENDKLHLEVPEAEIHVVFEVTAWTQDLIHLKAERDDPDFSDTSCVYELTIRRQ